MDSTGDMGASGAPGGRTSGRPGLPGRPGRQDGVAQPTATQVSCRLGELAAEFAGWRIGHGGSGHWWAVRGNELIRTLNPDDLRDRLREAGL